MRSERAWPPAVRPLGEVSLFAGIAGAELRELEQLLRRVDLQPGEVLFRQGEDADGLVVVAAGAVGVYGRLPGGGEVELARLGSGEVLGELALVGGDVHTATVRALQPTSALVLGRAEFLALVSRTDATAFTIKRGVAVLVCERLRRRYAALTGPGETAGAATVADVGPAEFVPARTPADAYLARLPFFRNLAPDRRAQLVDRGRIVFVPSRRVLLHEGAEAEAAFVTINGAVEELLGSGERRIRVRLAGPGRASGFVGVIDGRPLPVTVATRERALLFVVPRPTFTELFDGGTPLSHAFVEAVQRDLAAALRQADLPQARLAVSR